MFRELLEKWRQRKRNRVWVLVNTCIRCGEFPIVVPASSNLIIPEFLEFPEGVCVSCVTDEEWKAEGISSEWVRKELQFLDRFNGMY